MYRILNPRAAHTTCSLSEIAKQCWPKFKVQQFLCKTPLVLTTGPDLNCIKYSGAF